MAFRDALLANEHLCKVLTETEVPNLEGQVDFDLADRRGWGSFGDVYMGQYNGISVCVKILREIPFTEDRQWEKFLRRLKREVTVWRQALHPNVVALLGWTSQVVRDKIQVTLISTWCDGGNIKDYLRCNPMANRYALIKDVCRGLAYLHSRGIVHGDIKPVNIVVDAGLARLCDFGLSSLLGDLSTYTQSTSTGGTTRFLSPELMTGVLEARNSGSDVWAFGCASGEILCDQRPYHWITNDRLLTSAITKGPPYAWPEPDSFVKCLTSCFEINLERRPSSSELLELLSPPNPVIASLKLLLDIVQLDRLPLRWRYEPKIWIPELVPEFNRTISSPVQSICREWCDIVQRFPSRDPEILAMLTQLIPCLLHWVAAMGIMGELDCALRGLYDLHKWAEDHALKAHLNDIYCVTLQSRKAIIACPLSLLGGCHPFVPDESVLRSIFGGTSINSPRGRIHSFDLSTNKSWTALSIISDARCPRFSPEGRHLAFISRHRDDVFVRDLVTGNTSNLKNRNTVTHIAFSPDSSYLALSTHRNVCVWKWEAYGTYSVELKDDRFQQVQEVEFSPDGQYLACCSVDGDICIWNVVDWMLSHVLSRGIPFPGLCSIAFSPDSHHIALSTFNNSVIWDIAPQPVTRVLETRTGGNGVVFSPDGHFVASVNDHSVHLWNVSTWTRDFTFEHPYKVKVVTFSPGSHQLASCLDNGTVTTWDLMTRVASSVFKGEGGRMMSFRLEFSPDGRHLAFFVDGNVRVWDVLNKTISTETLWEHIFDVSYLGFSPDGRYLTVAFGQKFVGMLDLSFGTRQTMLAGHQDFVGGIAFSPDGSQLVSVSWDSIYVWNTETWVRDKIHGPLNPHRAEFSNDGRLILIHFFFKGEHYVDASTLKKVDPPGLWVPADVTTFPAPRFPVFLSDDRRSLCFKKGDQTIHFCWFPDSFEARSTVVQYNDMVCIGGEHGKVVSIDLAGFEVPNI